LIGSSITSNNLIKYKCDLKWMAENMNTNLVLNEQVIYQIRTNWSKNVIVTRCHFYSLRQCFSVKILDTDIIFVRKLNTPVSFTIRRFCLAKPLTFNQARYTLLATFSTEQANFERKFCKA
jgi:hypothetical protein